MLILGMKYFICGSIERCGIKFIGIDLYFGWIFVVIIFNWGVVVFINREEIGVFIIDGGGGFIVDDCFGGKWIMKSRVEWGSGYFF